MRFMAIFKASEDSEAGVMPSPEVASQRGKYIEELMKSGAMLGGERLEPSSKGARVNFSRGGKSTVVQGPFAEVNELIAGFALYEVESLEEAVELARNIPNPEDQEGVIEVRQIHER
jgi:hypothetical protein